VLRRILAGSFALSQGSYDQYFGQAQKVRALVSEDYTRVFQTCDVLLVPTAPTDAPTFEAVESFSPTEAYATDVFTVPISLAGLPSISIPAGLSENNLPLGVQVVGKVRIINWRGGGAILSFLSFELFLD
jgi:aspartyl-tRNA(Asn)/glutamyl-tRNA(Gln) amidotransferase subunit A